MEPPRRIFPFKTAPLERYIEPPLATTAPEIMPSLWIRSVPPERMVAP